MYLAALAELFRPLGFEPPAPPHAVFEAQQRHLLDTGTCRTLLERGEPVAFASAWRRGDDWFLGSLFVAPDAQDRGHGRALLDAVWDDAAPRRRVITDAIQPVSNALYARRGLIPATPILEWSGVPGTGTVPGTCLVPLGEGDLRPVDEAAYGFDRALDHPHWEAAGRRTVWARDGEVVAYSYAFPGGSLGPVAGIDPDAAAGALAAELARTAGPVRVRIPGSSRTVVEVAVAAGLRLGPAPGLLLLSAGIEPPTALAVASYVMY